MWLPEEFLIAGAVVFFERVERRPLAMDGVKVPRCTVDPDLFHLDAVPPSGIVASWRVHSVSLRHPEQLEVLAGSAAIVVPDGGPLAIRLPRGPHPPASCAQQTEREPSDVCGRRLVGTAGTVDVRRVDALQARELVTSGITVIDVLPPIIYEQEHLPGARNLPLETFDPEQTDGAQTAGPRQAAAPGSTGIGGT